MSIIIKNVSYIHPDREFLFENISFTVNSGEKSALIGKNGCGKSTLLRCIAGDFTPAGGEIILQNDAYYIPQHLKQYDHLTIAQALRIDLKLNALSAILQGDTDEKHFTDLADDWTIEERATTAMAAWELEHLSLEQSMEMLSGGEKTKVFLAGIAIHQPEIILMDEPSNHLDARSREKLYALIESSKAAILLVSHDRKLLNKFEFILEMESDKITSYGGNYDFYKEQKGLAIHALQQQVEEQEKSLRKAKKQAAQVAERKQKQDARGKKSGLKQGLPKIVINQLQSNAGASTAKLKNIHAEKNAKIKGELDHLRQQLQQHRSLITDLQSGELHTGKVIISAQAVNHRYTDHWLWENPLDIEIVSGERIAIHGDNGSGKSTLLKLLLGELQPTTGIIRRADFTYIYIDQEYSFLDLDKTVYEQAEKYNHQKLTEQELKVKLCRFLFPVDSWNKSCHLLSGGEKMRLLFCCLTIGNAMPDMMVLDEPTNNLDIESMDIITDNLKNYTGTVLVISHDQYFVEEINAHDSRFDI
ncbi:ATP-binding cassette domain-containing protein [Bacteroidales bacterium OttesenSCG-928-B11]|nr:ATP-binding cassette domain-containing protein [Bacteroidales bacterium OttesenSCG-928-B11]MDL2326355.1 ATP-binding cassette domain-containing protein [Bacteroidales bacterium OttesenSCG-928-A14]